MLSGKRPGIHAGWAAAALVLVVGTIALWRLKDAVAISRNAAHAQATLQAYQEVRARLTDAETGQRGYLLTGDSAYLAPTIASLRDLGQAVMTLRQRDTASVPGGSSIDTLNLFIERRLREIDTTIALRDAEGFAAAARVVRTNSGKRSMDSIRAIIARAERRQTDFLAVERERLERSVRVAGAMILVGTLAAFALAIVAQTMVRRAATGLKRTAEQLAITNFELGEKTKAAEEASEAKQSFLAVMSHELRTPLNAILGYTSLLLDESADRPTASQTKPLTRIRTSANALKVFIDEMLTYANLGRGSETVTVSNGDLATVAGDAVAVVEHLFTAKGLSLTLDAQPAPVTTDVPKVTHIVLNILTNAAKFTTSGGARVVVRGGAESATVDVIDTGIGIDARDHDRLFDAFYRVETGYARKTEGAGMGLATARRFARLLDGELTVASEAGRGSTFSLRIPTKLSASAGPTGRSA